MIENPAVARVRELFLAYGWNSTSFQIINPGIKRWFSDDGEAAVGYVSAAGFRVVAGAPVCAAERLAQVVDAFESDAEAKDRSVCYFCAERRLESVLKDINHHTKFLLGDQATWNPKSWASIISDHKSLCAQLDRLRNKGVSVSDYASQTATRDQHLAYCLYQWLNSKPLPFLKKVGRLSKRSFKSAVSPRSEQAVVNFDSSFSNAKLATETVYLKLESDAKWHISSYSIRD